MRQENYVILKIFKHFLPYIFSEIITIFDIQY